LNIPIAEKRLKERNFILKTIENEDIIPFEDNFFDIIINRHDSYEINELKRTLKKDGIFITQQVGGLNGIDINMAFETKTMEFVEWCLIKNIANFKNTGMEIIEYNEHIPKHLSDELSICAEKIAELDNRMYLIHDIISLINQNG
jgi:SAM-dependent methyltransferase